MFWKREVTKEQMFLTAASSRKAEQKIEAGALETSGALACILHPSEDELSLECVDFIWNERSLLRDPSRGEREVTVLIWIDTQQHF